MRNNTPISYAFFLLSRRDYAKSELWEKLNKRYNQEESEKCLKILKDKGFIDDKRFTRGFIRMKSGKGKDYLRQKLHLLKINPELIEEELALISDEDEFLKAKELALKYLNKKTGQDNLYQKVGGFLVRRGFDYNTTKRVLSEIL